MEYFLNFRQQLQTNKKSLAWQCCQKCVQKVKYGCKFCEKDEFGLRWLYFQSFHRFSPRLAYKLLPNTISTPNKLQNTQVYTTKPTGLSWNQK